MTSLTVLQDLPAPGDEPSRHWFEWVHLIAHRAVRPPPPTLPLLLDPMQNEGIPGSKWHLDHQTAHNNARGDINSAQILRDSDLFNRAQAAWWTFANHQEHKAMKARSG